MDCILVTGGAGFVGSSLALGLRHHYPRARIVALDNLKRRGSELNLPRLRAAGVEFVHGDIRNGEDLAAAGPFDIMLECSAEPSVLAGYDGSPAYVIDTNLLGAVNCFEQARKHGAGVIFLSTSRVYPIKALSSLQYHVEGDRFALDEEQPLPGASPAGVSEDFPVHGARSMYGATKLCSELLLQEYRDMYNLPYIVNRCGVIAGPWQMGKVDQGVVVLWAARHVYGGELEYIGYGGKGHQVRDILHPGDLLELVLHQIERLDTLSGELFNVGGGREVSISLRELTALCASASGQEIRIRGNPETRAADVPVYLSDCRRVNERTGWRPRFRAEDIVNEIVTWLREHEKDLRPILAPE